MSRFYTFIAATSALIATSTLGHADSIQPSMPLDIVPVIEIEELDWAAVFAEDAQRSSKDEAPRFAIPHRVKITPASDGLWERVDRQTMRWSLRVASDNAISLNLGFERWALPSSATMTIASTGHHMAIRPFTSDDNKDHGQLWTPAVQGDELLIEIMVSPRHQQLVNSMIELTSINVGYRGFMNKA